jgi:hypothetical protein
MKLRPSKFRGPPAKVYHILRTYAITLVRLLPIPLLHDWRKMEVCKTFNKGENDEGCLKFCNILK